MPESEKRSIWDRLFSTDRPSQREARVLEYIMHRLGGRVHTWPTSCKRSTSGATPPPRK